MHHYLKKITFLYAKLWNVLFFLWILFLYERLACFFFLVKFFLKVRFCYFDFVSFDILLILNPINKIWFGLLCVCFFLLLWLDFLLVCLFESIYFWSKSDCQRKHSFQDLCFKSNLKQFKHFLMLRFNLDNWFVSQLSTMKS